MATRTINLPESSYALLTAEAQRRGLNPDALADELVRADLAARGEQDLEATLKNLAELRAKLPEIDGIVLARDARAQLERRGDS
jgi:DNA-binding response OmpR family regulator